MAVLAADRFRGRDFASEVAESCAVGDQNHLRWPWARACYGFAKLLLATISVPDTSANVTPATDVAFIVTNPLAHGARLMRAVQEGVKSVSITTIADARFADPDARIDVVFPGVSARSMAEIVTNTRLKNAFALRRALPRGTSLHGSSSRLYREYLFLVQAMRYIAAHSTVARLPSSAIVLLDYDRSTYGRPWVWAANTLGLQTATLIHGSPNEANYVPVLAGRALVWGEVQKTWIEDRSPQTVVEIVGRPDLSEGFTKPSGPARRAVVCHSREQLSAFETESLLTQLRIFKSLGLTVSLRLHPSEDGKHLGEGWRSAAQLADEVIVGTGSFIESLRHTDIVVCVASSSAVEAFVLGVPAIVIAESWRVLPSDLEAIRASTPDLLREIQTTGQASVRGDSAFARLATEMVTFKGAAAAHELDRILAAMRAECEQPDEIH